MISLHNILSVAKYEARILRRSWLFRLFALGALFILTITNIATVSPVGDEQWEILAMPSVIPYFNLYILNIGQALVIVFLASDFLKKDKKLDTNEVLYTRSMSNFEYIIGKSWGIVRLFLGINIIVLLIALVINAIAKNTFIDFSAYLANLLLVSLPTIIYSLGLAYILMSLIKNQAITFLLLIGYAALDIFYLYFRGGYIFDYMLFGMPITKSQVIGFDNLNLLIMQRGMYAMLGLAFILFTTLIFKRLPQSRSHRILSFTLMLVSLAGALYSGYSFLNNHLDGKEMREKTIELNRKYEDSGFLSVTKANLTIKHSADRLEGNAVLSCLNRLDKPIEEYLLSLNPELQVNEFSLNGVLTEFKRDRHLLIISPERALEPGDSVNISLSYAGTLNEEYCYPWYDGDIKENEERLGPVPVSQRQVILTKDYALLTPEANWYPVASLNYYPSNPARIKVDFTEYNLKVETSNDKLTPISQGRFSKQDTYSCFSSENPLSGISLIIGDYTCDSLRVDSILFAAWYKPGNDFFKNDLSEIGDTLELLISSSMEELETTFKTAYPFKSLNLIEVPVQFRSIEKKNTQTMAEVQPGMILLPERLGTMNDGDFYRTIKQNRRRMERNSQVVTEKELQVRAFMNFVRNSFISSGNNFNFRNGNLTNSISRYLLGPSYYFFKNNFYSYKYPVINAIFESHLQKAETSDMRRSFLGGLSENDKANTILSGSSLNDVLYLDPSNDTLRIVLTVKGDYLFNMLRAKAGLEDFNEWFTEYLEVHKFSNISLEQFDYDLEQKFGFSIEENIENWFNGTEQPGFYFTNIIAKEIVVGDRTRYQLSFDASNPGNIEGIFTVTCRTMGSGRGMGGGPGGGRTGGGPGSFGGTGRGMQPTEVDRIVMLEAGQSKEINIILDAEPRAISFNTLSSMNNPGEIMMPIEEVIEDNRAVAKEDDVVLTRMPPFFEENEIIVDNEDPGFTFFEQTATGRLKQWLGINSDDRTDFSEISSWWAPEYWQKTVQSSYYGMFVKSAHYTRSGTGERTGTWTTAIKEPGYYDVYTYLQGQRRGPGGQGRGMNNQSGGGRSRRGPTQKDLHYIINHDNGSDEVEVDTENAINGWNHLGSYYISSDSSSVVLTNKSEGRIVRADAIRWIKQTR